MGSTRCSLKLALKLLRRLRSANKTMPVLYYHGCFESKHRAARAATAKKAGAFGEAILPAESLGLVVNALNS
jgi:hypothetical protein